MVEQVFELGKGDKKLINKVIFDENVHYIQAIFAKDEGLPIHYSNSNVYMTVIRGTLSIGLDDLEVNEYTSGTLLKIPNETKMNVRNLHDETLEIIIVKAPTPGE